MSPVSVSISIAKVSKTLKKRPKGMLLDVGPAQPEVVVHLDEAAIIPGKEREGRCLSQKPFQPSITQKKNH